MLAVASATLLLRRTIPVPAPTSEPARFVAYMGTRGGEGLRPYDARGP